MLFQNLARLLRRPDRSLARYRKMGQGIDYRSRRLALFWQEHLQQSREAQAHWAKTAGGNLLTVLGAGRLLDFEREALPPKFDRLRLVDANSDCRRAWRTLGIPYDEVCLDVTGCVDSWIRDLEQIRGSWRQTLAAIARYRAVNASAYCPSASAVLSLNLLSQLQIVWQDGVEEYLQRRFGKRLVAEQEDEWLEALRPAGQSLVQQHLAAIHASAATHVLILCDLEYVEYRGRTYRPDCWAAPPVAHREGSWTAEPGIECTISPALEGMTLDQNAFGYWLPAYRLLWQRDWLWHIAPCGTEAEDYGTLHRVGAFALERPTRDHSL